MAQLWCAGAPLLYAGFNASPGSALFLGTCLAKPDLEINDVWKDVHDQLGGDVPFDKSYQGQVGQGSFELNRVNFPVLEALSCVPNTASALAGVAVNGAIPIPGLNLPGDIGTLALTEGQNYVFWVIFPYFTAKAAMAAKGNQGQAVGGYAFPACMTSRESPKAGTDNYGKLLIVDFMRLFNPAVRNDFGIGSFQLYSTSVALANMPAPN